MFSKFTEEAQKILIMSKKEMQELKHPYVSSENLLLSILHYSDKKFLSFLEQNGITYSSFKNKLIEVIGVGRKISKWFLYTPLLKKIIENAILDSKDENKDVTVEQLFLSLLEEGEGVANRIMMGMNIDLDNLYEQFSSHLVCEGKNTFSKLTIEEFSTDFTQAAKNDDFDPVIGRDEEICNIIEILLRRKKSNPLLIGDAGVGKTALVEELARRIVLGLVPNELKNMRVLSVSISSLVAGTKYRGEFEERINKMIDELESVPNVILFIDEIHTIIGAGGAEGAIDASNILKPYLARGKINYVAIAPEMDDEHQTIKWCKENNIKVAIGHTGASYDECLEASLDGATSFTHTYNGMRGLHHREPGVVGAALSLDNMYAELIGDGVHVHFVPAKILARAKGKDKLLLITDSVQVKGLPVGKYEKGLSTVEVKEDGCAYLPDGRLAGSSNKLIDEVKKLIEIAGVDEQIVINAATKNPATFLGIEDSKGQLLRGNDADIIVIDDNYKVLTTLKDNKIYNW